MSAEGQLVDQFGRPVQMVATPNGWRVEILGDPLPPELHGPSIWVDPNGEGRPNGTFPVKHPNSGSTDKQKPAAPKAVTPIDNGTQGRVYTMPLPPPPQPKSELADYAERSGQVLEGYVEGLVEPVVESAKLAVEGWKNIVTEPVETVKALAWGAKELGGMALDGWRQIAGDPQQAVEAFVWAGKEALAKAKETLVGDPENAGRLIGEIVGSIAPLGTLKAKRIRPTAETQRPGGAVVLRTKVQLQNARQVPAKRANEGFEHPPYAEGTSVTEGILGQETRFVRLYDDTNSSQLGRWMMLESDIRGLTPLQIKDKFALPQIPTNITDVVVPAGTPMRIGEAGSIGGWGNGGGTQFQLMERIPTGSYQNPRKLP